MFRQSRETYGAVKGVEQSRRLKLRKEHARTVRKKSLFGWGKTWGTELVKVITRTLILVVLEVLIHLVADGHDNSRLHLHPSVPIMPIQTGDLVHGLFSEEQSEGLLSSAWL